MLVGVGRLGAVRAVSHAPKSLSRYKLLSLVYYWLTESILSKDLTLVNHHLVSTHGNGAATKSELASTKKSHAT